MIYKLCFEIVYQSQDFQDLLVDFRL